MGTSEELASNLRGWGLFDFLCLEDMPFWTRVSHFFVEMQTSRGVETQISNIGWVCLRTWVSRFELETRELHSEIGRTRVSHFESEMRVSRWKRTLHCWGTWASRSETEMWSTHCLRKMWVSTLRFESAEQIDSVKFSICFRRAQRLRQCSAFRLSHKGC